MTVRRRYLVCIPDGAAEDPCPQLGSRTPQEAAFMPVLAKLTAHGHQGWARTIPDTMMPASDVGIMAILGYDPCDHHTGRAPLEAASLGVTVGQDQATFRVNLVIVDDNGTMVDFAGGHPTLVEARHAMAILQDHLGGEVTFHTGLGYRNLMTAPIAWADTLCTPPHDVMGRKAPRPQGAAAPHLVRLMSASRSVLAVVPIAANQIWLWGQGKPTYLPEFRQRFGGSAALIAAVHVARGLGKLAGLTVMDVPGATGWYDTDYGAKRDAAIDAYRSGVDLVVIHVAATDEAGHAGDLTAKIAALEAWDRLILDGLVGYLNDSGPWRLLWIPDHATSTRIRAHTDQPVPFLIVDSAGGSMGCSTSFSRGRILPPSLGTKAVPIPAQRIMPMFLTS